MPDIASVIWSEGILGRTEVRATCARLMKTAPLMERPIAMPPSWAVRKVGQRVALSPTDVGENKICVTRARSGKGVLTNHHKADSVAHIGGIYHGLDYSIASLDKHASANTN